MITIWQTFCDPATRLATEPSTDSGLETLEQVEELMGEPIKRDERGRYLWYPDGLAFTTYRCA